MEIGGRQLCIFSPPVYGVLSQNPTVSSTVIVKLFQSDGFHNIAKFEPRHENWLAFFVSLDI